MPVPAIGYITYTIYPKNAIFTASYIDTNQTDTFSFTNEDCTIVDDHLFYRSGEVNVAGTTTIVAYGVTQTISTADGHSDPIININVPKPSNLYAWTVESGSSIYNGGDITTIYTKTPNPVLDTVTGNFTEFYDKNGNLIGGPGYSSIMSWTLTNASGKTASETYVNSMSSSVIELKAIGPA